MWKVCYWNMKTKRFLNDKKICKFRALKRIKTWLQWVQTWWWYPFGWFYLDEAVGWWGFRVEELSEEQWDGTSREAWNQCREWFGVNILMGGKLEKLFSTFSLCNFHSPSPRKTFWMNWSTLPAIMWSKETPTMHKTFREVT